MINVMQAGFRTSHAIDEAPLPTSNDPLLESALPRMSSVYSTTTTRPRRDYFDQHNILQKVTAPLRSIRQKAYLAKIRESRNERQEEQRVNMHARQQYLDERREWELRQSGSAPETDKFLDMALQATCDDQAPDQTQTHQAMEISSEDWDCQNVDQETIDWIEAIEREDIKALLEQVHSHSDDDEFNSLRPNSENTCIDPEHIETTLAGEGRFHYLEHNLDGVHR